mmetsp:Transcript_28864/g.92485  ORF Transcript_28864/g.92485 Transcript_28864/m.92485 type:complete len:220 (+) Transcript_28864:1492-2151(+)
MKPYSGRYDTPPHTSSHSTCKPSFHLQTSGRKRWVFHTHHNSSAARAFSHRLGAAIVSDRVYHTELAPPPASRPAARASPRSPLAAPSQPSRSPSHPPRTAFAPPSHRASSRSAAACTRGHRWRATCSSSSTSCRHTPSATSSRTRPPSWAASRSPFRRAGSPMSGDRRPSTGRVAASVVARSTPTCASASTPTQPQRPASPVEHVAGGTSTVGSLGPI